MLYSHSQIRLLLIFATLFLIGLAVREWRAGFPDAAERLERFDRDEAPDALLSRPRSESPPANSSAARSADSKASAVSPASSAAAGDRDPRPLDINRASAAELARLPGVGPSLAQRIVQERERRGRFESPDALRDVMGVGPKKLAALRDLVTAGK
jgi:competence ComEA-like helix-hairpin-helix protein